MLEFKPDRLSGSGVINYLSGPGASMNPGRNHESIFLIPQSIKLITKNIS